MDEWEREKIVELQTYTVSSFGRRLGTVRALPLESRPPRRPAPPPMPNTLLVYPLVPVKPPLSSEGAEVNPTAAVVLNYLASPGNGLPKLPWAEPIINEGPPPSGTF